MTKVIVILLGVAFCAPGTTPLLAVVLAAWAGYVAGKQERRSRDQLHAK